MEKHGDVIMPKPFSLLVWINRIIGQSGIRSLGRDRRGIAAVEFALILPILVILLIGMVEINAALTLDRKLSLAASSISDLVAQESALTTANLTDVMEISESIFSPYPTDGVAIVVAGVLMVENNTPQVQWSQGLHIAGWTKGAAPPIDLPADLIKTKDTFLVVSHATYTYQPTFFALFKDIFSVSQIELEDTYYLRPRISAQIACCS